MGTAVRLLFPKGRIWCFSKTVSHTETREATHIRSFPFTRYWILLYMSYETCNETLESSKILRPQLQKQSLKWSIWENSQDSHENTSNGALFKLKLHTDCMSLSCHRRVSEWIHTLYSAWMSRNSLLKAGVISDI